MLVQECDEVGDIAAVGAERMGGYTFFMFQIIQPCMELLLQVRGAKGEDMGFYHASRFTRDFCRVADHKVCGAAVFLIHMRQVKPCPEGAFDDTGEKEALIRGLIGREHIRIAAAEGE